MDSEVCGSCRFQHMMRCYLRPPEVVLLEQRAVRSIRPTVAETDPACADYQPRPAKQS